LVAAALFALRLPPGGASAQSVDAANGLIELLAFAPANAEMVSYSNLGRLRQVTGVEPMRLEDVPLPPVSPDPELTPEQVAGKAWWWDIPGQIPVSPFMGLEHLGSGDWRDGFGYDLFDIDAELSGGEPPQHYCVFLGRFDRAGIAARLSRAGYSERAGLWSESTLYAHLDDYQIDVRDPLQRMTLARLNRVLLLPGQIIGAPATELVTGAMESAQGQRMSLAQQPDISSIAAAMDDAALLPGTWLLSATLVGEGKAGTMMTADVFNLIGPNVTEEQKESIKRQILEAPSLPIYRAIGLGYRRGPTLADRFWLFTLLYDDETLAAEAAQLHTARMSQYRSLATGQPLLTTPIAELLPPVVQPAAGGVTLSLLLRVQADNPGSWTQRFYRRDLAFLTPGQMIVP